MALNDGDRSWIRETIREANKPGLVKFCRDWLSAAAAVALGIFIPTQYSNYHRISR